MIGDLMPRDSCWMCVDVLATTFEGSREGIEQTITRLEQDIIALPSGERDELRRKMIVIIAAMSRLEVRLCSSDGPSIAKV